MLIRSLARACGGGGVGAGAVTRRAGGGASCRSNSRDGMKIRSFTGPRLAVWSFTFCLVTTRLMSAIMIMRCTIAEIRKPWRWSNRPTAASVPRNRHQTIA